jgi:hypothetical protein
MLVPDLSMSTFQFVVCAGMRLKNCENSGIRCQADRIVLRAAAA